MHAKWMRRCCAGWVFLVLLVGSSYCAAELELAAEEIPCEGRYTSPSSGESFDIKLLRWRNPLDGEWTYGALVRPKGVPQPTPLIVFSDPYSVFPETGDPVDLRWAERLRSREKKGPLPDADMDIETDVEVRIHVSRRPLRALANNMDWYINNGYALLYVFCRFYKADSLLNDAYDVLGGILVAKSLPGIDKAGIGVTGTSWGGMTTVYAISRAERPVKVAAAAGWSAAVDSPSLHDFVHESIPSRFSGENLVFYRSYFYSYWHRLLKSTKEPFKKDSAAWEFSRYDYVARNIRSPLLLICGSDDSIVPYSQSLTLTRKLVKLGKPAWVMAYDNGPVPWDEQPLSHGARDENSGIKREVITRNFFLKYMPPDVRPVEINVRWAEMMGFLKSVREHLERHPEDRRNMVEFVLEAMNPSIRYKVTDKTGASGTGAEVIARGLNQLLGTDKWDAKTVRKRLEKEGFPLAKSKKKITIGGSIEFKGAVRR